MSQSTTQSAPEGIGRFVRVNLPTAELYEHARRDGEGIVAADGALVVRSVDTTDGSRGDVKVTLPKLNAHTVGQLLYMLEVETAMAGRLYNINTFDQPGVEEGKVIARKLMGA